MASALTTSPAARQVRDRAGTERRLIEAVGELIARDGFDKLGSRTVARQAGVDHMLINRYFGSLQGLLHAYADSSQHWPSVEELTDAGAIADLPRPQRAARILVNLAKAMSVRPMLPNLLAVEAQHQNELTDKIAARRQDVGTEIAKRYLPDLGVTASGLDEIALLSLLAAAINYITIRAGHPACGFGGMGVKRPEDLDRLSRLIESICESCMSPTPPAPHGSPKPRALPG